MCEFRTVKDISGWAVKAKRPTVQIRQRYVPGYLDGSKGVVLTNKDKSNQSKRVLIGNSR